MSRRRCVALSGVVVFAILVGLFLIKYCKICASSWHRRRKPSERDSQAIKYHETPLLPVGLVRHVDPPLYTGQIGFQGIDNNEINHDKADVITNRACSGRYNAAAYHTMRYRPAQGVWFGVV